MSPNNSFRKLHFSSSIKGTSLCYCQEIPHEKCQIQIVKLENEKKPKTCASKYKRRQQIGSKTSYSERECVN